MIQKRQESVCQCGPPISRKRKKKRASSPSNHLPDNSSFSLTPPSFSSSLTFRTSTGTNLTLTSLTSLLTSFNNSSILASTLLASSTVIPGSTHTVTSTINDAPDLSARNDGMERRGVECLLCPDGESGMERVGGEEVEEEG